MTGLPENVVRFDALAGLIFLRLFEGHPSPTDLVAGDFFPFDHEAIIGPEHLAQEQWQFFQDTIRWLNDEGFLVYEDPPYELQKGSPLSLGRFRR